MKIMVLVPDGVADFPLEALDGKTPLEVAKVPHITKLARMGQVGRTITVPEGYPPASDVGNLSILGYDPAQYYCGRAPLEAVNMGVELQEGEVAFRCNLITASDDTLADFSAGHIPSTEAKVLIEALDKALGGNSVRFYPGISYRHLVVVKGRPELLKAKCTPPHDIMGQSMKKHYPRGESSDFLIVLMEKSREILGAHEVNKVRVDLKENPASSIWLWGQGTRPALPSFQERFGMSGSLISAVDLLNGMGRLMGLSIIKVPGATGYYDTNYQGKAELGIGSLKQKDFIFIHVEATDEAGHNGDVLAKITAIENFDKTVVKAALEFASREKSWRILLAPDHVTSVQSRTHTRDAVPFVMAGSGIEPGGIDAFSEKAAGSSALFFPQAHEILEKLVRQASIPAVKNPESR